MDVSETASAKAEAVDEERLKQLTDTELGRNAIFGLSKKKMDRLESECASAQILTTANSLRSCSSRPRRLRQTLPSSHEGGVSGSYSQSLRPSSC